MLSYAIGDIHGHLDKLRQAHELIEADRALNGVADAPVIHVGDLVDRGPDSRGVIQFLIDGIAEGRNWIVLMGNHDRMFHSFLNDPDSHDPRLRAALHWLNPSLGGDTTLASYGVKRADERLLFDLHEAALSAVPEAHRAFLAGLPLYHERDDALFVHAGIRPGIPLTQQEEDDLLWIREDFHDDTRDHGALVVHGHTPVEHVTHYGNRLNIDTGAGHDRKLSAVAIEGREAWVVDRNGRTPAGRAR